MEKEATEMENMGRVLSAPRKFCKVHRCDVTDKLSGIKRKSILPVSNDNVSSIVFPNATAVCKFSMRAQIQKTATNMNYLVGDARTRRWQVNIREQVEFISRPKLFPTLTNDKTE